MADKDMVVIFKETEMTHHLALSGIYTLGALWQIKIKRLIPHSPGPPTMNSNSQAYRTLLSYLHSPTPVIPLETICSSLAYHLAYASPPTQLTASAVSAPIFLDASNDRLSSIQTAFRHAVLIQRKPSTELPHASFLSSLFTPGARTRVSQWLQYVLQGLQGGASVTRFMCLCGLVSGLDDIRISAHASDINAVVSSGILAKLEGELVVTLAEILDVYHPLTINDEPWQREFRSQSSKGKQALLRGFRRIAHLG